MAPPAKAERDLQEAALVVFAQLVASQRAGFTLRNSAEKAFEAAQEFLEVSKNYRQNGRPKPGGTS